jgi:hypothetical protein
VHIALDCEVVGREIESRQGVVFKIFNNKGSILTSGYALCMSELPPFDQTQRVVTFWYRSFDLRVLISK